MNITSPEYRIGFGTIIIIASIVAMFMNYSYGSAITVGAGLMSAGLVKAFTPQENNNSIGKVPKDQ